MLRELVASLRGVVGAPAVVIAIGVLTLTACGIKGPLTLPPPTPAAVPASSPAQSPAAAREPAERKP